MKRREPLRAAASALLLVLSACRGETEQRGRGEAERFARAVSALRDADNAAKRPLLAALSAMRCAEPSACELQRVCSDAYRAHLEGVQKSEQVRSNLDARDAAVAARTADLLHELDSAEQLLRMAREGTRQCTELEGKLRRQYRV
ncbi:MAG TPA: hypothetical protein VK524_28010 [Polyangiaceae bacterium]|nr:hypothetical protein [Polyangiaceae bacterium]